MQHNIDIYLVTHKKVTMHYPCIHIHALSMHSNPCTIHAFNLVIHKKHNHTSFMHYPCIMYTRILMHCQSCIVIHLDIYKITSTP